MRQGASFRRNFSLFFFSSPRLPPSRELPSASSSILSLLLALSKITFVAALFSATAAQSQSLAVPARPADSVPGRQIATHISSLPVAEREVELSRQILAGNVPPFLRHLCPVSVTNISPAVTNVATFFVAPDYLCVGSDDDFFFTPLRPSTTQEIAWQLNASLPTRKMVDAIYAAAEIKLAPAPIPPGPAMTTVPVFLEHSDAVRAQRLACAAAHPLGALTAGDKKDVVISARLAGAPGKVAIYGWHKTNGAPIQPLYLGHTDQWADYSHGIRLVAQNMIVDGTNSSVRAVLADPKLCALLSDEGPIDDPRDPFLGERISRISSVPDVEIELNEPAPDSFASNKPVWLIAYALPNGNSIAQTAGRKPAPAEDWRFDIQHIAAQTRFLRFAVTNKTIVVAYLQAAAKSWPAWRVKHGDAQLPAIIDAITARFSTNQIEISLASHSGGGSFVFGWLNAVKSIPTNVLRLAFLDSDYGYDSTRHAQLFADWLRTTPNHALCVLAYDDADTLLNGKPFVTPEGGTWGRTHAMLKDLSGFFDFHSQTNNRAIESYAALDGRLQILLHENPERKILHTVQVERNGFIHAMLVGTPPESAGYEYFGDPAYSNWIR